jgi:hypothetical protein
MILTAHQPVYLPWLGLFHKMFLAEKFCVFDIVQYQAWDYNNRNQIKTRTGPIWLSVPVEAHDRLNRLICDIRIVPGGWNKKHIKSIKHNYQRAPFFKDYIGALEDYLLGKEHVFLTELNVGMLEMFLKLLDFNIPIIRASSHSFRGKKSDLVLDMCMKLGVTDFIFGEQGRNYADVESFSRNGIRIFFQKYVHPTYSQINGPFLPYMSIIDLLFNVGAASRQVLLSGNAMSLSEITQTNE